MADDAKNKKIAALYDKLEALNIDEDDDPELNEIRELAIDTKYTTRDKDKAKKELEMQKLTFNYLMQNKLKYEKRAYRPQMDLVLVVLASMSYELAKNIEKVFNDDETVDSFVILDGEEASISVDRALKNNGIEPPTEEEKIKDSKPLIPVTDKDNTRVRNLKMLHKKLTSWKCDHIFYKNRPEFKAMIKSIDNALKYCEVNNANGADPELLKVMYDDIAEKAKSYLEAKDYDPGTKVGKARQELALATLLITDEDKGKQMIDQIAEKKKADYDTMAKQLEETFEGKMPELDKDFFVSADKIKKAAELDTSESRAEKLENFSGGMLNWKKDALKKNNGMRELSVAQYIIRKSMYDKFSRMSEDAIKDVQISNDSLNSTACKIINTPEFKEAYAAIAKKPDDIVDVDQVYVKYNEILQAKNQKAKKQPAELKPAEEKPVKAGPEVVNPEEPAKAMK